MPMKSPMPSTTPPASVQPASAVAGGVHLLLVCLTLTFLGSCTSVRVRDTEAAAQKQATDDAKLWQNARPQDPP